jgi:long-chain fatty acid transport protein
MYFLALFTGAERKNDSQTLFSIRFNLFSIPAALLIFIMTPSLSEGAGLSNFTQGAGPMGVANATIAHHEGISSIYYNPAHQLAFEGINIAAGATLIRPEKEFDSTVTGDSYESNSKIYTPVHLATTYRVSEAISLAFTLNNSFGLGSEFPDDTIFRYLTTESKLTTWDMNPSFAYKLSDHLVIAAGFRAVYTDVSLKQKVPLQTFGLSDGEQTFTATGTGYGWNIGTTYSPTKTLSFGASYRSPVDVDLSGDVSFDLPQNNNSLLTTIFPETSADSELNLPGQLFLGIAYKPSPKWVFEAATRFEQYSSYEKLEVTTQQSVAGQTSRTITKDWNDVWGYMFGMSYQTDAGYRLSGGYLYEENPVPDETFEPAVSGLDKHTFTVGAAKRFGNITGRISYAHDFYEDRKISNSGSSSVLNGTHSQENQMIALTLSWHI